MPEVVLSFLSSVHFSSIFSTGNGSPSGEETRFQPGLRARLACSALAALEKTTMIVDKLGAEAFIPFKINTSGKSRGSQIWGRMYHYFKFRQPEFMAHCHRRSNIESTFSMIKAKFGDSVKSKNKIAQENELLCKIICHNVCVLIGKLH